MKTPIEMLNAIIKMQEANYGNATNTHMDLNTLVAEAKEVVKNYSTSNVVKQSEQLKAVEKLKDFAYEVCPLHREDDLEEIVGSL